MEDIIKGGKDFRIIPKDVEYSTSLEILGIDKNILESELKFLKDYELGAYKIGESVEVFGSVDSGLVYCRCVIKEINGNKIKLLIPENYTKVQRREYSRMNFDGSIIFKNNKTKIKTTDISAGGIKFVSEENMIIGKDYEAKLTIDNLKDIECALQPIRSYQTKHESGFVVCARFSNISSADKVAIVQHLFRKMMETENGAND